MQHTYILIRFYQKIKLIRAIPTCKQNNCTLLCKKYYNPVKYDLLCTKELFCQFFLFFHINTVHATYYKTGYCRRDSFILRLTKFFSGRMNRRTVGNIRVFYDNGRAKLTERTNVHLSSYNCRGQYDCVCAY